MVFESAYVTWKFWNIMTAYKMPKWDPGFIFIVINKDISRFIVRVSETWDVHY